MDRLNLSIVFLSLLLISIVACDLSNKDELKSHNWSSYLGGPETNQYSSLDQINVDNVHKLERLWVYRSGGADTSNRSQIQTNPLVIDVILLKRPPGVSW